MSEIIEDVTRWSATRIAGGVQRGELSPVDVVRAHRASWIEDTASLDFEARGALAKAVPALLKAEKCPAALKKPADWLVGCVYPGEREHFEAQGIDYEDMVLNGPWSALTAWRNDRIAELQGQ